MVRITIQTTNKTGYLGNTYIIDLVNDGTGTPEVADYYGEFSDFEKLTKFPIRVEGHVRPEGLLVLVKKAIDVIKKEMKKREG